MDETCTYAITVRNNVDASTINACAPLPVTVTGPGAHVSHLITQGDQSGLIGLLRYLHQQGYLLLSVIRQDEQSVKITIDLQGETKCPT